MNKDGSMPVNAGEIRAVSGGYGLMMVLRSDEAAAEMLGHGGSKHWFPIGRLSEPCGAEVVRLERAQAAARLLACNSQHCWCRKY